MSRKWQYVGQDAFNRKSDLFDGKDVNAVHPDKILEKLVKLSGCDIN